MINSQKTKKIQLGPLNLSKTNYKPYFGSLPNKRNKQNIVSMGPLENIMIDIPQIQQTREPFQLTTIQKLRFKIRKFFEQKSSKSKQQWQLYLRKSQIMQTENNSWAELQTFLLKIISDLICQIKSTTQINAELIKFKEEYLQSIEVQNNCSANKSLNQIKTDSKFNKTINFNQRCKFSHSNNQYSKLNCTNISKNKGLNTKNQTIKQSFYINQQSLLNGCASPNINLQRINEGRYQFQISKLQKEIELYKQQIKKNEEDYKIKLRQMQNKIQVQLKYKYSQTLQQKMKYQNEVQSKKFYNDVLAQQFKLLKKKYLQLQQQNSAMKKHYLKLKQDKDKMNGLYQYKELWLMQYQQILQLNRRIHLIEAQKQSQISKTKGLKQKLKQLSKNFNYNYNVSVQNQKDKQDLNKVLKQFRDWLKFFAVPRVSKGMMNSNTFFPEMDIDSSKQNLTALLPKDDSTNYKLLRPNFFIYFEAYEGIIMAERKFPQRKVMPPSFYLTIRAILDAMFLHFNFTSDYKQWINFPEFVISFLQKFQINLQAKKPVLRKSSCQSEQKINFLLNIFNIQAANSWQCQIFRSFILEQMTLDQIYFYLDCRNRLLKGAHLNNNFGSSDATSFVRVNIAEQVVKDKLRNYDRQMLDRMKKFINSKKKIKYGKELIDLNFVLKLLLQVYSIQKIKSQRFFHHNFRSKTSNSKISYTEYSAFMSKNFDFLTKTDIARLYRQMYTLSVSHITYKTIHYVCSMKGLFIPLLRKKMSVKVQLYKQPTYPKVFQDILYSDVQNSLNNMVVGLQQFGLEQIIDCNISINKFLHDCENMRLSKSNFQNNLLQQTIKILKIRQILSWKNQRNIMYEELTKDQIRQKLTYLLTLIHQSDDDLSSIKKWREKRDRAVVKLTRNFKIRIQQSLAEFKVLDKKQYEAKIAKANQLGDVSKRLLQDQQKQSHQQENKFQQKTAKTSNKSQLKSAKINT